jgi:hypothetical protein
MTRRKSGALAALTSTLVAVGLALPASGVAAPEPDHPQHTNVPYLAWVGEQLRLVVCDPQIDASGRGQNVSFALEEWTGNQNQEPKPDGAVDNGVFSPGSVSFFAPNGGQRGGCVKADYKSVKDGLARIRVTVYDTTEDNRPTAFTHQFLAIWLVANKPSIHESAVADFPTTAQLNASHYLGDPSGNGVFTPSSLRGETVGNRGLVQVKVSGSFGVQDPQVADFLGGDEFTLPTDWVALANKLARSDDRTENTAPVSNDRDPMLWDIHGTPAVSAVDPHHVKYGVCSKPTELDLTDATDNCQGGESAFSRVFGDVTWGNNGTAGIGPFDPQRPQATLLSDGRLNEDDAPMPALPVIVSIAPHTMAAGDIGGVGGLFSVDKKMVYSRDFTGSGSAHNLYNPFYRAFVPATAAPVREASGVTGGNAYRDVGDENGNTDNFPGFTNDNPYRHWTFFETLAQNARTATTCLRATQGSVPATRAYLGDYYQTPGEYTSRLLMTDERGEAFAGYNPGTGFFFDSLIASGAIKVDNNNGCDLQTLLGKPIGKSAITATVRYPYQSVSYDEPTSAPLTKQVNSLWSKTLSVFPKNASSADTQNNVRILVATAHDIDGQGFAGETICFTASAKNGQTAAPSWYSGSIPRPTGGPLDLRHTEQVDVPNGASPSATCVRTDSNGNAAVEVENSNGDVVDVAAQFFNEGLYRFLKLDYSTGQPPVDNTQPPTNPQVSGSGTSTTSSPGPTSTPALAGSNPGTTSPSADQLKASGVTVQPEVVKPRDRVVMSRVVKGKGKAAKRHFLLTGVLSYSRESVQIRVLLLNKAGKVVKTKRFTIRTNKLVKRTLPWGKGVKSVRVRLVG